MKLLKIPDYLSQAEHKDFASRILEADYDGISLSYHGGAFGPTWSEHDDYDLGFLEHYVGIRAIELFLPGLTDLSPVAELGDRLENITLGECKKPKTSLSPIFSLPKLKEIALARVYGDFEAISEQSSISTLALTGYRHEHIQHIAGLTSISKLYLGFGTLDNLRCVDKMSSLEHLEVMWAKRLASIDSITKATSLRTLKLACLNKVTSLPDLSGLKSFRSLIMDTMNGLTSLQGLKRSTINELAIYNSKLSPDLFPPIAHDLPALQRALIGLVSRKNTEAAKSFFSDSCLVSNINHMEYDNSRQIVPYCQPDWTWPTRS